MGWRGQGAGSQWGDFPPRCANDDSTVLQAHVFPTAPPGERMSWPGKGPGFKGKYLRFRFHHGHLKAVWPQAIYLALKHLTFSIYKMGANVLPQQMSFLIVQMTELMHAPQLAQGQARGAQQSSPPLPVSPPEPRLPGYQSGAVPTHYISRSSSQQ